MFCFSLEPFFVSWFDDFSGPRPHFFEVLLTVHLSIILVINQLNSQNRVF